MEYTQFKLRAHALSSAVTALFILLYSGSLIPKLIPQLSVNVSSEKRIPWRLTYFSTFDEVRDN